MAIKSHSVEAPAQVPTDQINNSEPQPEKHEFTRGQKVLAAIAGATVLGGGAVFGIYKGVENGTKEALSPGTTNSANPNPETQRIRNQTLEAASTIEGRFSQARNDLNAYLAKYQQAPVPEVPSRMSETMSTNDILSYYSVANYIAGQNPAEKDEILAGIVDPTSPHRNEMTNIIQEPGTPVSATWEVQVSATNGRLESPVFHQGRIADYSANGTPSRVAVVRNKITGKVTEDILSYKDGQWLDYRNLDPKTDLQEWVIDPEKIEAN